MSKHKCGTEINLNGLRIFISPNEEIRNPGTALDILRREYYDDSDMPPIIVGLHACMEEKWVVTSCPVSNARYQFPESLVSTYDVLDHGRDIRDEVFSNYHILGMVRDAAIFGSLYDVIAFFSDEELSSSGIDGTLEAMRDRRTIPILSRKGG